MSDEDELTAAERALGEGDSPLLLRGLRKRGQSPGGLGQLRSALEKPCPMKMN
jgi:hypothetical protein